MTLLCEDSGMPSNPGAFFSPPIIIINLYFILCDSFWRQYWLLWTVCKYTEKGKLWLQKVDASNGERFLKRCKVSAQNVLWNETDYVKMESDFMDLETQ